jgi:hypothetical protein
MIAASLGHDFAPRLRSARESPAMTSRTVISQGQLYRLLNDAWRVERPPGCAKCMMPMPMIMRRPDDVSANWRIGAAPWCAYRCDAVIAEISSRLWPLYDLGDVEGTICSERRSR